jgi:hypothetical protein
MDYMIFKVNYNGEYQDSFIVEGDTTEEIREIVLEEVKKRNWNMGDCWSEEIRE